MDQHYFYAYIPTPLGHMVAIARDDGLYILHVAQEQSLEQISKQYLGHTPSLTLFPEHPLIQATADYLQHYFQHPETPGTLPPLRPLGTPFSQHVWQQLQAIPVGQTRSYGQVAQALHRPGAARAIGRACGANPLLIIIPCHRVVQASGRLGGFRAGAPRKAYLLDHEQQ